MSLTVPTTAPFSGAQKMWLKGYLDALNSALMPPAAVEAVPAITGNGVPVTILWGSQTGNSEALGKKLVKVLGAKGHSPTLRDMAGVAPADLAAAERVLIITSTYGDGEPPDNAAALHAALHSADAPSLTGVSFSVLALGDSGYPDFCKCGRDFQNRMAELGAEILVPIIECDVDYDEPFARWSRLLEESLDVSAVA
ncbi:flavodoxin domain-containing protein [Luteolibacter yonseiensis]|uniref:Flavodoxin domain-containing protein n=1 Tax=Luteolibacter yonseiensis TaxID=1144680 RepID=A0A934R8M0_9BACT|nr:flavodoxin domain-containing protein [Luteolibacter yonseiensis]MBK1817225.1 flavodoxin domain-containing protein [Luteolibacter yonseiensis]